ncbi:MAG: LAGLIDADG family homing endonuclease [Candidatus Woesearchaeota archaeon]
MRIKKLKSGFEKLTKEKSRIIAHLIGDGCAFVSRHDYNMKYEVSDRELLNSFEKDMVEVYGLKLTKGSKPSGKTGKLIPFVRLRSKLVYEDLLKYSSYFSKDWKINRKLLNSSREIKREFLKAFFDDEGSVYKQGNKGITKLYSINLKGLKQIQKMLLEFGITGKIYSGYGLKRNVYAFLIDDLKLFHKEIGFNLKRKQEKLESLI